MPLRKGSTSDKNKGTKPQQKGAEDQGEPPDVPESPTQATAVTSDRSKPSSTSEQSEDMGGREEADGVDSSQTQASGGQKLSKKEEEKLKREQAKAEKKKKEKQEKERREREKRETEKKEKEKKEAEKREKEKQDREKKETERQEREREKKDKEKKKEEEKARKQMEKQRTRSGSQSRRRNTSQTSNEAQLSQGRHTPSEESQGSQTFTNLQDSTLEEGAKQMSSEAQGDVLQMTTADDSLEPDPEQLIAFKSQQEAKDKRIAELEQELEQTKSARKQMLQGEIALLKEKEAVMKAQYQQNMSDFEAALQRRHAEVERFSNVHATEMQAMQDDHSKKMSQLCQEKQQSENEKDEEAKKLQEELHEVRRESVQFKERANLLETRLKEKEVEQEVCALPPDHHVEDIRKLENEFHKKYEQEINQLKVAFEKREAESKEEIDRLRQELKATDEKHTEDVKQLCESRQENEQETIRIHQELQEANEKLTEDLQKMCEIKEEREQEADRLRQELKEAKERHTDEVKQLQLKNKDEQELNELRLELEESKAKNTEEIQQLKSELEQKDAQHANTIADIKTEYEDKQKREELRKDAELQQKIKRQDAVASGRLRDMKNEIERLKGECETKDAAIVEVTEELEKMKKEKELEMDKYIEATKKDGEKSQHEQRRQLLAEASKKQKEHDQQLEIKRKEMEYLKKQLHQASDKLTEEKGEPETVQKLKEQLQEKDDEMKTVVAEIQTLQDSYEKLIAEHEHLEHLHEQLKVEVKMKRELAESSECVSCDNPSDTTTTVSEPQLQGQLVSDTGTTEEERDFQSASESSFTEREEDGNLTDMEKMQLLQKVATAEKEAKHAREALQKMSNENKTLRDKLDTMNKQVQRLEEWHRLLVEITEQASSSEVTVHESQEKVIIDREKHVQLKRNFIHLTERYMKIEKSNQELLEKIEERDKQIKELQLKVRDDSVVPKVYESLSSGEGVESVEELSHDDALKEIKEQKEVISELRNCVASLQAQMSTFEKTAAEHSKMEQHGKEQSKAVKEWRQKYEAAENKLKEQEDELHILKGEVSAKRGQPKDSIDVQQMEVDYEGRIEALNTAMNTLEVDKAELTAKCATKELVCEQLEQENQTLQQTLKELDGKHSQLKCLYDSVTQQLSQLNEYRGEVDAMKKQAAVIHKAITAKTVEAKDLKDEKESLQKILEDIADELESRKIQAQTYKEDFEKERKDRAELASRYDSEKAAESVVHQAVVDDLKTQIKDLENQNQLKQTAMKQEHVRLEGEIQRLNQELKEVQEEHDRDKDSLQIALGEKQSLEDAHSKLDDKYRDKEAHLEKALAHKSDLEEQLKKSREDHECQINELQLRLQQLSEQLRTERTELQQQIARANENITALSGDCQAKTQQVKQYKKQVDTFRVQVDSLVAEMRDSRAKIVEYEGQLEYYQEQVRQLNEDDEQKAAMMKAQCEADMLNMSRDLEKLKREKVMWEMAQKAGDQRGPATTCDEQAVAHVQNLSQQLEESKRSNHALDVELHSQRNKYFEVTEKCEVYWRQIDTLLKVLQQNGIPAPKLEAPSAVKGRYPAAYPRGQDNMQPNAQAPRSPNTPHVGSQIGQEGELHSLPANQYTYDGGPDKSMTSPAAIGPQANQQFEYNQQLIVPGSSPPMPHPGRAAGGIQRQQYQSGYARQGDGVALGQQNRYQQGMQGQLGGGGVPRNPQHRMENIHGAGFGMGPSANHGIEPQGLVVATEESGQHERSGPQENALIQGINTEMHNVAAVVGRQVDNTPVLESLSPQAPLDPNLICPMCRRQFRIGEIQKYRQHVKLCHGT